MRVGTLEVDGPRALLVGLALVTLVALVVAASTSAASFGAYNRAWDGASALRGHAEAAGADPTVVRNTTAYERVPATGTVAVVLAPTRPYGPAAAARVRAFVEAGGTLVVAADVDGVANRLLAAVGADARVDGRPVRDERYHYRSPAMPEARNVSGHPLVSGVEHLTLNHGTTVRANGSTVLVSTSGFSYVDANRNGRLDDDEALGSRPVATVETVGAGRVVVLGDPSIAINAMLERPGNAAFVRAVIEGHDRVLLDYSHARGLPPLAVAVLVARESWLARLALGLGLIGLVALWELSPDRLARRDAGRPGDAGGAVTPGALEAWLAREHPAWDPERVRRVVKEVYNRGPDEGDDG